VRVTIAVTTGTLLQPHNMSAPRTITSNMPATGFSSQEWAGCRTNPRSEISIDERRFSLGRSCSPPAPGISIARACRCGAREIQGLTRCAATRALPTPEHASIPIMATSSPSFALDRLRRSTTSPLELTPCNEKVLFAKSIPSVETRFMGLPLSEGWNTQLNPDTSVSSRDGEVTYIR